MYALAADTPRSAARVIGRFFFGTTAGVAAVSAALMPVSVPGLEAGARSAVVAGLIVFAVLNLLAVRFCDRANFPLRTALCSVSLFAMLLIDLVAAAAGDGAHNPALGFCGVIVCVIGSITGVRLGVALALCAATGIGVLGHLEQTGVIAGVPAPAPIIQVLIYQWLVLLCSAIGGALISRVLGHYLRAAAERETRFRGLLRIATDWYWEQDRHFQFTTVTEASIDALADALADRDDPDFDAVAEAAPPRRALWRLDEMGLGAAELARHRAELEAHLPFDDLRARRRDASGQWRTISLAGEPKFGADGSFAGYWGVARDVTDEVLAQHAVAASETRYRELFTRSPSPLFLHRRGMVFDANEAAARLFGFASASDMNGLSIVTLFPLGSSRERVLQRLEELETMPLGDGLPVTDYQLRATDGRPISVQATAVRIDTLAGPANLSIMFDITARKAAESALRRSEAMLSQLFATSPDCVLLMELATGRFAMVNAAFCQLTGFAADEVIGKGGSELGLWDEPAQAERLLAQVTRDGRVHDMPAVFVAKSGARVSMLLAAGRFMMDQRDYLVVNAHDVTETERTRLQHAAILERASIGIASTRDGRFVQANPYFERMFGWELGSLPGQPITRIWVSGNEAEGGAGEAQADEAAGIGELGAPMLATGRPFEIERRMRRRDGTLFWCRLLGQAIDRKKPDRGGTIWIAEDVTERRRLDAALAAARDAAEAASRAKSTFLANTSHEIRTPLNGLLGLARLAMQPRLAEDRRQQYLAQIIDSADGLAGIMSDILDVSKIEAGKFVLEDVAFDLHEAVRALHHAYEPLAEVKGLDLQLALDPALPIAVRGDPMRVRQILTNFVTNALKFTEHGHVRIEAAPAGAGQVRLAVSDTGPGITAEALGRLFLPFSQGDSSTTRRYGGTGLGLSICREIAHLMGGQVGVDSVPGEGSSFWALLPLPEDTPSPAPVATGAAELGDLSGLRVLLAEDNPVNMMIGVAMLENWQVEVDQAVDGRAAIDAVEAAAGAGRPFDLIVMDVQMPVMSGHEAARALRLRYSSAALPIVALTAAALVSERAAALDAGMDAFLTKPVDARRLRETLVQLMQQRSAAQPV